MGTKLGHPPSMILIPQNPIIPRRNRVKRKFMWLLPVPLTHSWIPQNKLIGESPPPIGFRHIYLTRVADADSSSPDGKEMEDYRKQIKSELYHALQGINRGIFGVANPKKCEIEGLVELLESHNPNPDPCLHLLHKVSGCWSLMYSTITILGSKRTKLGLRDFIALGDFVQTIDVAQGKAVNEIKFSVRGFNSLNGQLTIQASFNIASNSRVNISYENSTITPPQLMNLFSKNYQLLLGIFNPEGWLDITYVDETIRIGRDDKGNIFIVERWQTS